MDNYPIDFALTLNGLKHRELVLTLTSQRPDTRNCSLFHCNENWWYVLDGAEFSNRVQLNDIFLCDIANVKPYYINVIHQIVTRSPVCIM